MSQTATTFASAMNACATTWNGALSYASPDLSGEYTGRISLFFKAVRGLEDQQLFSYLTTSARESVSDTFLLAFQLRDCRGGKGERALGRKAFSWLAENYPTQFEKVFSLIPEYGRWDDLHSLPIADKVAFLFAEQLKKDKKNMEEGLPCTLCAKWAPTEKDSTDRKLGTFSHLAKALRVLPRTLRKEYLTPLRAYIKVVENYMCTGKWDQIDFNKVPSCAMKRLKKAFQKHDPERFNAWKEALKLGDKKVAKVNAKQLFPYEIVREMRTKGKTDAVLEAQWKVMEEEVEKLGSLKDCIAVVDTSGSMMSANEGLPLDVAVSLGMLISKMSTGTFHGHLLTFEEKPSFAVIPDTDVYSRYLAVHRMSWGGSTNLEAVFSLILSRGKTCKLRQEDMPKRLFIISDMQFNSATSVYGQPQTNMERINEMYASSGYTRPQIVFWNVNGSSTDFPCTKDENGTVLISGFSPSILKAILNGKEFSTVSVLRESLDDARYLPVKQALGVAIALPEVPREPLGHETIEAPQEEFELVSTPATLP